MSKTNERLSVTAILTGIATSFAVSGVTIQVVAYALARNFYLMFNIEPETVGLTPLSAAWRLSTAMFDLLFIIVIFVQLPVASLIFILMNISLRRAMKRDAFDIFKSQMAARLVELRKNDPHEITSANEASFSKAAIAAARAAADKVKPFFTEESRRARYVGIFTVTLLLVGLTGIGFFLRGTNNVQEYALALQHCNNLTKCKPANSLQFDLSPEAVRVQWFDLEKVPTALSVHPIVGETFPAFELGAAAGRTVLWFTERRLVISVADGDVAISRAPR